MLQELDYRLGFLLSYAFPFVSHSSLPYDVCNEEFFTRKTEIETDRGFQLHFTHTPYLSAHSHYSVRSLPLSKNGKISLYHELVIIFLCAQY